MCHLLYLNLNNKILQDHNSEANTLKKINELFN